MNDPVMQTAIAMTDAFFGSANAGKMIADARKRAKRLSRLEELSALSDFISDASLIECKLIINELADSLETFPECADKLEDAACALTKAIESEGKS